MTGTIIPLNSNPNSYVWAEQERQCWHLASNDFQEFYQHWYTHQTDGAPEAEAPYVVELSPAGSPLQLLPETQGRLVVRKSYQIFLRQLYCEATKIGAAESGSRRGGVILGDRGIGKSMFLWYALVSLLKQRHVVLFHWRGTTYLFYLGEVFQWMRPDNVSYFPRGIDGQFVWSLVDMDTEPKGPQPMLTMGLLPVFPIQASFPSPIRHKYWRRKMSESIDFGMPLWDKKELLEGFKAQTGYGTFYEAMQHLLDSQTGKAAEDPKVRTAVETATCALQRLSIYQASMDANIELLIEDAMEFWGADPCSVYRGLLDPVEARAELDFALRLVSGSNLSRTIKAFECRQEIPVEEWHALIAMQATRKVESMDANNFRFPSTVDFTLEFKSPRIGEAVMQILRERDPESINKLYRKCTDKWMLSPLARWFCVRP